MSRLRVSLPRPQVSFRVQSVLIVAAAVASVSLGLIAVQAQTIRNQVIAERTASMERVVAGLQQSADYAAASGGRDFQRADLLRRLPEVAQLIGADHVVIFDSAGGVVADTGAAVGARFDDLGAVAEVLSSDRPATRPVDGATQIQALPFVLAGGESGVLATRIQLQPMLDSIAEATRNSLVPSLLVLLAAIPLAGFVSNRILARTYEREQQLRVEARFGSLVRNSSDLVLIVAPSGQISYVSPSVERVLGYGQDELQGRLLTELLHDEDTPGASALLRAMARRPGPATRVEWRVMHQDGTWRDFEMACTNLTADPTVAGLVLNGRDISERKALEEQLTHQAFHDPLTGLANRALFEDRVNQALTRGERRGTELAVLFLDLDDFKTVNDSLGHHAGDRLLSATAERLHTALRSSDTVARLGGDEFAVLLEEVGDTDVERTAERVVQALREPFEIEGQSIFITASTGIALTSAGPTTTSELLRGADMAMYAAKNRGKGEVRLYDRTMHQDIVSRLELDAELRRALERGELTVHYQPIVHIADRAITGFEALVRWQHPERGLIMPELFIKFADDTGLIDAIGRFVIGSACRQVRAWQMAHPGRQALSVGVNLSARQINDPHIVETISQALAETGLPPSTLVIEFTESTVMQDSAATLERLFELKQLGVRLAIDDFGTGYSALSYLRRFPVDIIKIDRSFVEHVADRTDAMAVTRAIIDLTKSLRLRAIAEGVEQPEQAAELLALGCEYAQGYLFGRPLEPAQAEALISQPSRRARAGRTTSPPATAAPRLA